MTPFEKIENFANHTNDIDTLRDMLIEVISNNNVNIDALYLDHKKQINKEFIKPQN